MVRVVPDVAALDRALDYAVPPSLAGRVAVGAVVRVPLHGRRVRGWVVQEGVVADPSLQLSEVARVTGLGPDADVIGLCRWAAWRWAGRLPSLLRVATPERAVPSPLRRPARHGNPGGGDPVAAGVLARGPGTHLLTVSPSADPVAVALAAAGLGQALVVAPALGTVEAMARGLGRAGVSVARWPGGYAAGAGGHTVVGGRAAVFAPLPGLAAVVVWDEHDEGLQSESSPTWHARELAIERARRAGVPCLLVSPCPSLEARAAATTPPASAGPAERRRGWAPLVVVDRRHDDMARTGLYSEALVEAVRTTRAAGERVVCVLNRTGRARLLACRSCGTVAECERCGAAVQLPDGVELVCSRCGTTRPTVCLRCGATAMKLLRAGVTKAREDLEALLREPVGAVSATPAADTADRMGAGRIGHEGVLIGTEAVLHRVGDAGLVAFLDVDQELLAPRYRAAEEALALLVLATRLVGGRTRGGRVLVQTRLPDHEVLAAAVRADPDLVAAAEGPRRDLLGLPPSGAVAAVGGEAAPEWVERLGRPPGVEVQGPREGWWLLRADRVDTLCDALAAVPRPPGRLRLQVDPARLP